MSVQTMCENESYTMGRFYYRFWRLKSFNLIQCFSDQKAYYTGWKSLNICNRTY